MAPVSYTHLDVYKRQALPNALSTPEIKVPVETGNPHEIVQRFVDSADFEGARPVSYTHLDVYKRQPNN